MTELTRRRKPEEEDIRGQLGIAGAIAVGLGEVWQDTGGLWHYGEWRLDWVYPPIPDRSMDWAFWHDPTHDYDSPLQGHGPTMGFCIEQIDAYERGELEEHELGA